MRIAAYANTKPVNGQGPTLGNMSTKHTTTSDGSTDVFKNTFSDMVNYTPTNNTNNYLTTTNYLDQMPDYSTQISNSSVDFSHVDGMIKESTTLEQRKKDDFCHGDGCEGTMGIPRPKMPQIDKPEDLTAFIEIMKQNNYEVGNGKVNFKEDNIIPTQGEVRISRSKRICKLKPSEMMGVPIIVIKGEDGEGKEEIIILDGHHRSYAKKNCSVDPIENVIIVSSKSGETAKQTVKNIISNLKNSNPTSVNFFPKHAFGGRKKKTKKRRLRKRQTPYK